MTKRDVDGPGRPSVALLVCGVSIGMSVVPGFPTADPEQISPVHWGLHTTHRDEAERVFGL